MQRFEFVCAGEYRRLDHFLATELPQYSRSRLQSLIVAGGVQVDGTAARKVGQPLEKGSVVTVEVPQPSSGVLQAESIPIEVMYEDANLIVLNKPAAMVVHPGAGHLSGTLVNAVLAHAPDMEGVGGEQRPGVVHRLDRDTSGVLILAKTDTALQGLQRQFQDRTVQKTYLALVDGRPPSPEGRVEAPIGRDPSHRKRMAVVPEGRGRNAITEYKSLEEFPQHTLLEVHPVTGRTHQVRVHCAFLRCPVVGDRVYGRREPTIDVERHLLHAWKIRVVLPEASRPREFTAPLPNDIEQVLVRLRSRYTPRQNRGV